MKSETFFLIFLIYSYPLSRFLAPWWSQSLPRSGTINCQRRWDCSIIRLIMQSECSVLFGDCPPVWGTDNLGDISLSSLRLVNALTATPSSSSRANCEIFPFPVAAYALPCSFVDQFVATDHLLRFLLRCPRHIFIDLPSVSHTRVHTRNGNFVLLLLLCWCPIVSRVIFQFP